VQLQQIIHYVPNDQLGTGYPTAQAAIIGTGSHKPIIDALTQLYVHQHTTPILYTECMETAAAGLVNSCLHRNLVTVVVGNARFVSGEQPFSAAVIAPSANMQAQDIYRPVLEHPQLDLFSVIGFQTYLTAASDVEWLHARYYETLRLGAFRECAAEAEPLLRESNHVFFDLNVLRASDAPETRQPSPNGLYAEELCQLAAYAGRATKLQTFRLFNFIPTLTPTTLTAQTAAQVLWHLLEGIAIRHQLAIPDKSTTHIKKIIVDMGDNGQVLEFLNDTITGYWWLQIPLTDGTYRPIACLPEDYHCACRREIPVRWLRYFQKFNREKN
jgi:hypothetical protein